MSNLEAEKEEFKQYQNYDKICRPLEYIIHADKHNKNEQKLTSRHFVVECFLSIYWVIFCIYYNDIFKFFK